MVQVMTAPKPEVRNLSVSFRMGLGAFEPIGRGVALPGIFTATFELASGVVVKMDVAVRGRRPVVESVTISGAAVGSGDLRLPLAEWLDWVVSTQAVTVKKGRRDGDVVISPPTAENLAPGLAAVAASRGRTVTDDDLRAFAEAYKTGGIEGAADELFISDATAYRRLRKCRAQGLLPEKGGE